MKNWKTNLGAFLVAVGAGVIAIDPNWSKIGSLISLIGTSYGLLVSRDYNVTSEQSGAKNFTPVGQVGGSPVQSDVTGTSHSTATATATSLPK